MSDPVPWRAHARYSTVAIILHWLIAAFLIFEVGLGLRMEDAHGAVKFAVFQLHKSVGITILLLILLRLVWRFYRRPPVVAATGWERILAQIVHALFYLLLFALPISGWVIVSTSRTQVPTLLYGTIPWPHVPGLAGMAAARKTVWNGVGQFIHVNLVTVLYVLFALHVAGALKHHFLDRDGDLARMAPGAKSGSWRDPRLILIAVSVIVAAGLGRQWMPIGRVAGVARQSVGPPPAASPAPPAVALPASKTDTTSKALAPDDQAAPATEPVKANASSWTITPGSSLHFKTIWSDQPIEGGFHRFDGTIVFSPDDLDHSHVEIRIQTGSVFSGDDQRDETLKGADWFSVSSYGVATFKADRFRKLGAGRFVASGSLALKGVTLPVSLPFSLTITGDKASMQGTASIDRTAYKIGEGDYASTAELPAAVTVEVAVHATRKP